MIREDIRQDFSSLFGRKKVHGREVDVELLIAELTREFRPAIAEALTARRHLLQSTKPVRERYAWPKWGDRVEDPVTGKFWTYRQIVQGMIDNFLGVNSESRWRLNDQVPIPADVHPLDNAGLELTGPWHPLDMAFNALNSAAPMNMPDFEDASPPHFRPDGSPANEPVGVFAALQNAKEIFEGQWTSRAYEVQKKGKVRRYQINNSPSKWPTRLVRPPSLHVLYEHIEVDNAPVPGTIAIIVLWVINNYDSLKKLGTGAYFYIPKVQTPQEALIFERVLARVEDAIGVPAGNFKIKMLYEEGIAGLHLAAIAWVLRRRLLGTNVGRWDYLGSLIEMWKDDPQGVFPDPQTIGMATPTMIAYQRYNALTMLMAGMKDGELRNAAPIGGMAAVMIYQPADAYGRARYNPLALRAMAIDKLRERLLGLIFVPASPNHADAAPTLEDILADRVAGKLYDTYRQSWVASPEPAYVQAGNVPLRASLEQLQGIVDAPQKTIQVKDKQVPAAESGLAASERALFQARGLLNAQGQITPVVVTKESLDSPEKLLNHKLWDDIYSVPTGDVTIEHIQHSFYMAANYGYQILNGNFAAAIDDYELGLRFMNDLATYRIYVSWLWSMAHHHAVITKNGYLKAPELTDDGVVPSKNIFEVKAGTRFTPELFAKVWELHNQWTNAFFAELDRSGDPGRFDRSKAPLIMELLKRQLLSPCYIQHSARALFVIGQADGRACAQILNALFDLSRQEVLKRVQAGAMDGAALAAYDYVYDVFPDVQ